MAGCSPTDSTASDMRIQRGRLHTLLLIGLILLAVFAWMLTWDPLIDAKIRTIFGRAPRGTVSVTELLRDDPHLGYAISQSDIGYRIQQVGGHSNGYLVVYVGSCSACMRVHLDEWEQKAKERGLRLLLFTNATPDIAKAFIREAHIPKTPIISDIEGKGAQALNASFAPRAYLFSADWHLRWLQREPFVVNYDPFSSAGFPNKVGGAIQ